MRVGFVMQLNAGNEAEYRRRHDEIWPELSDLLKESGISDYYIFLHSETNQLFATFVTTREFNAERLKQHPLMRKWWRYMAPLMETVPDSVEPLVTDLTPVFFLE